MAKGKSKNSGQPLMGHWGDTAKDKPLATAAAAAGAVAAGVFLWSKRNEISDQISRLSDQITDWADEMRSGSTRRDLTLTEGPNESAAIEASRATAARRGTGTKSRSRSRSSGNRSARGMSETGGGNASLGAHAGTTGTGAEG